MGKPKAKSREKNYAVDDMNKAIAKVKNGMSILKASHVFNVPRSTLSYKCRGHHLSNRKGPEPSLTYACENVLEKWIISMKERGFPVTSHQLRKSVQDTLNKLDIINPKFVNNKSGVKWLELFLARHPSITLRTPQCLARSRARLNEEDIRKWFEVTEKYLVANDLMKILREPDRVFNADESAFFLTPKGDRVLAPKGDKTVYAVAGNSDREAVTVLMNVSAAGFVAPPMIVYKYEQIPAEISNAVPEEWGMGRSKTGWMTTGSFFEYVTNVFEPWLTAKNITRPIILFLDGHVSHLTIELSDFCVSKRIEVIPLYPNATHVLQPLDVGIFRPFKSEWKKIVADWRLDHDGKRITKAQFPALLSKAVDTITVRHIESAFRATGICPFSVNSIDFSKLILKKNKLTDAFLSFQNDDQPISSSTSISTSSTVFDGAVTPLEYLENHISPQKLMCFKECDGSPAIDAEERGLFRVWRRMTVLSIDVHPDSSRQLFLDVHQTSSLSDLSGISPIEQSNRDNSKDVSPSEVLPSSDLVATSPNNLDNVRYSTPIRSIPPAQKYSEDFSSALKWPALKDTNDGKKKKEFPLAITSRAWRQHYVDEEEKRKKREKEKEDKKLLREKAKEDKKLLLAKKKEERENLKKRKKAENKENTGNRKVTSRKKVSLRKKPESSSESSSSEEIEGWSEDSDQSSESFDEEEMAEIAKKVSLENKNKKNEKIKTNEETVNPLKDSLFKSGDWVLVKYNMAQQSTRFRHFLGQIVGEEDGKLKGRFVRSSSTKENRGFVYSFPKEDDICLFSRAQVVKKVDDPKPYGRYGLMLFNINVSEF